MTEKNGVKVIELEWDGPHSVEQVSKFFDASDYGLYQIYGTHSVFGPDTLLYIGKAERQFFGTRFSQHSGWFQNEPSDLRSFPIAR